MMKRFERLDIPALAAESMQETRKDFEAWQQEQLYAGKKKTGGEIKPFYKPSTIAIKKKKGQPTDRVTLRDTGFFHSSLFLVVKKGDDTFKVVSSDTKAPRLLDKYGDSIFGLGGVFKIGYIQDFRPVFMGKIHAILKV
jgi:hypothetical protein